MPSEYQTLSAGVPGRRADFAVGRGLVGVDELPSALLDAFEVGVGLDLVDALAEECGPVVRDHLVEVADELVEVVRNDFRLG